MVAKWNSQTHSYKMFLVNEPFCARLASRFSKSANMSPNFFVKICNTYSNNSQFRWPKSVENCKKVHGKTFSTDPKYKSTSAAFKTGNWN